MYEFFQSIRRTRDWFAVVIVSSMVLIAAWLVILPISSGVQRIALDRFHLATPDFYAWAIQQPVPAMYNLENRYWISDRPLAVEELRSDIATNQAAGIDSNYANHFPARMLTFGDARFLYLYKTRKTRYLYLQSRYQDQALNSLLIAKPVSDGGYELSRSQSWPDGVKNE